MSAQEKPNRYALDVSRFADTTSYELAVLVHRVTEAERTIEKKRFEGKHGPFQPPKGALAAARNRPDEWSASKDWGEFAKTFSVLEACRVELGVSLGEVARRIALELRPANAEVIFWIGKWSQSVEQKSDIELQLQQHTSEIEQAKEKERQARRRGGLAKNEDMVKAKEFVLAEWTRNKDAYGGNRSAFGRVYVVRILKELDLVVKHRTISVNWLGKL